MRTGERVIAMCKGARGSSVRFRVCVAKRNEYIPMGIGEQPDSERQEPLLVQAKVFLMEPKGRS
jgi:hypothetical protein